MTVTHQTTNSEIWTSEFRIQNLEYRIQNTDYRLQTTDYRLQTVAVVGFAWPHQSSRRLRRPNPGGCGGDQDSALEFTVLVHSAIHTTVHTVHCTPQCSVQHDTVRCTLEPIGQGDLLTDWPRLQGDQHLGFLLLVCFYLFLKICVFVIFAYFQHFKVY